MPRTKYLISSLIFSATVLTGCLAFSATANTAANTPEKIDFQSYSAGQWKSGQQIYQAFCIHCHETGVGPAILGRHYSSFALIAIARHGINTMPTFRTSEINDQEIASLAKWVEQAPAPTNSNPESKK